MAQTQPLFWLSAFLFLLCFFGQVQSQLNSSFDYTSLTEAFPPLEALYTTTLSKYPLLGGQNLTRCCLKAINQSYVIRGGQVLLNPISSFIDLPPSNLSTVQFPCDATYNESNSGAPLVIVPFSWCTQNCAGWQRSTNKTLTQWVQPFVGFISPAAVFCLNVPRTSALNIQDIFFQDYFEELPEKWKDIKASECSPTIIVPKMCTLGVYFAVSFLGMVIKASIAASLSVISTIIWLAIVFSYAGPMFLSGLYEAAIDRKIIRSIRDELAAKTRKAEQPQSGVKEEVEQPDINTFNKRVHQLYAVLVGNLSLLPLKDNSEPRTVWRDIQSLVKPERLKIMEDDNVDRQSPEFAQHFARHKEITRATLTGMLDCQVSFGGAIGAPVVFFLGSFLFNVISNRAVAGDNDTSHAIAFGQWWMIIPHVAIVSGCLLAGNNPNTLEVVVSHTTGPWPREEPEVGWRALLRSGEWSRSLQSFRHSIYTPYYRSVYVPVRMSERGRNKRRWIDQVFSEYYTGEPTSKNAGEFHLDQEDWIILGLITFVLQGVPFVLAFLTSYYTPTIGLSCRTVTFLLYFCFQVCLNALWIWEFFHPVKPDSCYQQTVASDTVESGSRKAYRFCHRLLLIYLTFGSVFTTVVGTFLQIIGVYRNCLCEVPVQYWYSGDFPIVISTDSAEDIRYAKTFWQPTAIASIVLLVAVCYIGWWYQRHWRMRFREVVNELLPLEEKVKNGLGGTLSNGEIVKNGLGGTLSNGEIVNMGPHAQENPPEEDDRIKPA